MTARHVTTAAALALAWVMGSSYSRGAIRPPPVQFQQDGGAYSWDVWPNVTADLTLSRREPNPPNIPASAEFWGPQAVVSCSGLHAGGLQARFFRPTQRDLQLVLSTEAGAFRVRTGEFVARVDGRPTPIADTPRLIQGRGDLPDDWFDQLGRAKTLEFRYGNQVKSFPGPGPALAAHFRQLCEDLHSEGMRDQ